MNKTRSLKGRGIFYHRDSGGKHDQSLPSYVEWVKRSAVELKVEFDGTAKRILEMVKNCESVSGDLFLDYCVTGNTMSRAALDQVLATVVSDSTVSHLFIARRERLFRPDEPFDAVKWEENLREMGVTIVYQDKILGPLERGQRKDLADRIIGLLEFDKSGRFRAELASKMIHSHAQLAALGFSAGGRAPYGFRRWLVNAEKSPIRELGDGEVVRLAGHHVCWLPGPDEELNVVIRILRLLPKMNATQVAILFNSEGIPAPDTGRTRKDKGIIHEVSGLWHQNTITNIARRLLVLAETTYGQRSMGDQLRHSTTGPRELVHDDRDANGKPKVVKNPDSAIIRADANFLPLIDRAQHEQLLQILDKRGGTQRGKPRSRDPKKNPLGCRIFDLACSSVMYRFPSKQSFGYRCGLYEQSNGQECSHNQIDGVIATRFALAAVQQQICSLEARKKLEDRLRKRAAAEASSLGASQLLKTKEAEFSRIQAELKLVTRNLARANDDQFQAISDYFNQLTTEKNACQKEIENLKKQAMVQPDLEREIAAALRSAENLYQLADDSNNFSAIGELFNKLNLRLFLRFQIVQKTKRAVNKLAGGVLTMGVAPPPINLQERATCRAALKLQREKAAGLNPAADSEPNCSGLEAESLGNENRDDRI